MCIHFLPVVDQFSWGLMKSIAKQIEFGDKEINNGELSNQINIGVICTEGIELNKKIYHPCSCGVIWFICKKSNFTKVQPVKAEVAKIKWKILESYVNLAPNKSVGVKNQKQDEMMHNETPKNFRWIRQKWRDRFYKSVTEWIKMIFVEFFVITITVITFPLCGLFLILYISRNANYVASGNRYANRPLSLWWNALIENECKYIFMPLNLFHHN